MCIHGYTWVYPYKCTRSCTLGKYFVKTGEMIPASMPLVISFPTTDSGLNLIASVMQVEIEKFA